MDNQPKQLGEILPKALPTDLTPPLSIERAPENYDHIILTSGEALEALRLGRERKHYQLIEEEKEARRADNRRMLTEHWTPAKTRKFMELRNEAVFGGVLNFENGNGSNFGDVFRLLCLYFSNDNSFVIAADSMKVKNPDLRKGILILGSIGTGKTTLMQLFGCNQRQVFMVKNAAEIADKWANFDKGEDKDAFLSTFAETYPLPINDMDNFYHRHMGLCLDDCGTEDIRNNYGNRKNVIGDIIEMRYANRCAGVYFHMTSNLTTEQLKEHYGQRVASRLRETMNVIHLTGQDRRK